MLGHQSVDIFKRSSYKISALEFERVLLDHNRVMEAYQYVVALPDAKYGQHLVAILRTSQQLSSAELRKHMLQNLAEYKVPQQFLTDGCIPKNAMGKVNKKELIHWLLEEKMRT